MTPQAFQKSLDKSRLLWYNTRRKVKPRVITHDNVMFNKDVCKSIERAEGSCEQIKQIAEAISTVSRKHFPSLPVPCIAGGSIRDTVFGLPPRDYDVFLDVHELSEDEKDDHVLLFGTYVLEQLFPFNPPSVRQLDGYTRDTPQALEKDFVVYENVTGLPKIQFIGRTQTKDELLSSFDWPLTKAMYNPETGDFIFDDAFINCMNTRKIKCRDQEEDARVANWVSRYAGRYGKCPFDVEYSYTSSKRSIETELNILVEEAFNNWH